MTYVETQGNVWETVAGRAPGSPVGPGDPGAWDTVADRLDPERARPVLRAGIESAELISLRGSAYVMLRSPDGGGRACYLRLAPQEWQLAQLMDGTNTVARLVAEFARIAGRLAPDQVRRVVADLAGNRMLDALPAAALRATPEITPRRLPARVAASVLAVARGRRMAVVDVDGFVSTLYRAGGRLLFTRAAAVLMAVVALAGPALFVAAWWRGGESLFLTGGSYLLGALLLLALNVLALACHELGHALAAKHAGREVPAAGLRLHFGIPSVFVDTTDVWMAGRRARIITTAAGPIAGLVLAGSAQLVGLAVPALAPLGFKLAFLWYLHTLINLSPFLALDGSHLLMDWLEVPNLRGRALSWAGGRLRRRPPRFSALDREGRMVALYGFLALLWLAIAINVAYRILADRVSGLVTGLWFGGWPARTLLVAVVLGLCAPVVYLALGRVGKELGRYRARLAERRREADAPRRLAALRASDLNGLPAPALAGLAARARWLRPATGRQLVVAGGSLPAVYVVVDGALQARRPGDPGGTVRHHVGPGGVVGLADALTGRPASLDWHTAGTTLLALPTAAVATVIGPLPGPPPADRAQAEALFADTPALAELAEDERLALIAAAHPVDLEPGAPVMLAGPTHAVVVESGVIAMPDGVELRRGTLVGPVGDGTPGMVAQARTPVRLWVLPDASNLPPLVGSAQRAAEARAGVPLPGARPAPGARVRPAIGYPPLAAPPGPPGDVDPELDHRFERRLWWLVLVVLLATLMFTAGNLMPGPAWAEMPADRVMLTADRGDVTAAVAGRAVRLRAGERRYVPAGTRVEVAARSTGRLTFRGGAAVLLCAGAQTSVGQTYTERAGDPVPHGTLSVDNGRVLADTTSTSRAFAPLALLVLRPAGEVRNVGAAWYAVDPAAVAVATGRVLVGGTPAAPAGTDLSCGDGVPVAPPSDSPSAYPSESPSADTPSVGDSASTAPTTDAAPTATTAAPTRTVAPPRTGGPATTPRDRPPTSEPTTIRPRPTTNPTTKPTTRPPTIPTTRPTTQAPPPPPPPTTTEPPPPDPAPPANTTGSAGPSSAGQPDGVGAGGAGQGGAGQSGAGRGGAVARNEPVGGQVVRGAP